MTKITNEGFNLPTQEDIFNEMKNDLISRKINVAPFSNNALITEALAHHIHNAYLEIEQVRVNMNPREAGGEALDVLGNLKSVARKTPKPSRVNVLLTPATNNQEASFKPGELRVRFNDFEFYNERKFVLPANTEPTTPLSEPFVSDGTGARYNLDGGLITEVSKDDSSQIASVTNPLNATGGADRESDDAYRLRVLNAYPNALSIVKLQLALDAIKENFFLVVSNQGSTALTSDGLTLNQTVIMTRGTATYISENSDLLATTLLNSTPINTIWHTEGAVKIDHVYNSIPLEFYLRTATAVPVKFRVTIYGSDLPFTTNGDDEVAETEDIYIATNNHINDHLATLLIGEKVMAAPLFNSLNQLDAYKALSNFRVEVKRSSDEREWDNDYDVVLKYYETVSTHSLKIIYEK